MKIDAKKQNTGYRNDKDPDILSQKKRWQLTNGEIVKVRMPNTMRAKELRNLYRALKMDGITADERIEILFF
jgi:hypothetical protein